MSSVQKGEITVHIGAQPGFTLLELDRKKTRPAIGNRYPVLSWVLVSSDNSLPELDTYTLPITLSGIHYQVDAVENPDGSISAPDFGAFPDADAWLAFVREFRAGLCDESDCQSLPTSSSNGKQLRIEQGAGNE